MVVVATTLQFVVNIVLPFSYTVHMFIVLPFLSGVFALSYFQGAFVIGMHEQLILVRITMSCHIGLVKSLYFLGLELVGPSKCLFSGTIILDVFVFGEFFLVLLEYFIRDWKWLQLAFSNSSGFYYLLLVIC